MGKPETDSYPWLDFYPNSYKQVDYSHCIVIDSITRAALEAQVLMDGVAHGFDCY